MMHLENDHLEIEFPELGNAARLTIAFKRTLRLPDDGNTHPLPPSLGEFPLRHIEDFDLKESNHLKTRGGIVMPMFQADALWINFNPIVRLGDYSLRDYDYPVAVKIGTGKICAVSGEDWSSTLNRDPQDYIVVPKQPWIDGYNVRKGKVKQFVAAPLGEGYTAEEQITGKADIGGIQIQAFPMKKEYYDEMIRRIERERRERRERRALVSESASMMSYARMEVSHSESMGLAPGGAMHQKIYEDPHPLEAWDLRNSERCFITIANAEQWMGITGEEPPISPRTAHEYTQAGLPWFDYYDGDKVAIDGAKRLGAIKSVKNIKPKHGEKFWGEDLPVTNPKVVQIKKREISAGEW